MAHHFDNPVFLKTDCMEQAVLLIYYEIINAGKYMLLVSAVYTL